jgi:hypothetical protein
MNNGCSLASEIECGDGYKKHIIGDSEESPLDISPQETRCLCFPIAIVVRN